VLVSSEAASFAGHQRLGNLCWLYDSNRITIEGQVDIAFSDDVAARFMAYGWNVERVGDANDIERLAQAIGKFKAGADGPTLIIVNSHIGFGAPHKQDTGAAHGEPLGEEEIRLAKRKYGWPEDAHFLVPAGVREHFDRHLGRRGRGLRNDWEHLFIAYRNKFPDLADQIERMQEGALPMHWDSGLTAFPTDAKGLATRDASGKVLNAIAARYPWLIGGSADLAPSTKSRLTFEGAGELEADTPGGRNLHFGVREHAMGAILNGMALCGIRPFGSTFLIFSDYMKPPIRLSALMELPIVYVFTHDSIGVGEDGPTHQPVEQLTALRSIPGIITLRPADANEVVEAWRTIIQLKRQPACLALSRQILPTIDRTRYAPASNVRRGAYVLADTNGGPPDVILIGTGSEVGLCLAAYELLSGDGIKARVVSMPSWELFEQQDQAYRDSVLLPGVAARVCVEMGSVIGWDRYAGPTGARIGIYSFGASAPLKDLLQRFGFTAEAVATVARGQIAKSKSYAAPMTTQRRDQRSTNPLLQLREFGQAVWLDFLSRQFIADGSLRKLVEQDGLTGVTSNPSIFQKAIAGSQDYDASLRAAEAEGDRDVMALYEKLAIEDIRHAADALGPAYQNTNGQDGYVSLEVSPYLAMNAEATIAETGRLWRAVGRANIMIKVPATKPGLRAIRELIGEGINVNITLLFSQKVYRDVVEAYLAGLEHVVARGGDPNKVNSVASFFVGRIDTAVDKLIDVQLATKPADQRKNFAALRGKIAIANAKLAYQSYKRLFAGARWEGLKAKGARVQRLLWASTGVKNPSYRDVLYVEEPIAPNTVNTLPPATLDAFRDHGKVGATLEGNIDQAEQQMAALDRLGISIDQVTDALVIDGVKLFAESFDNLLGAVARKRVDNLGGKLNRRTYALPAELAQSVTDELEAWRRTGNGRRLWDRDASLWTAADEGQWLGWLTIVDEPQKRIRDLQTLSDGVRQPPFTHIVLLGMGGSSLGPEVLAETFGPQPGRPTLLVLDSTDPVQICSIEAKPESICAGPYSWSPASRGPRSNPTSSSNIFSNVSAPC
jgi:transketolase